jgi:hypothetical protein
MERYQRHLVEVIRLLYRTRQARNSTLRWAPESEATARAG